MRRVMMAALFAALLSPVANAFDLSVAYTDSIGTDTAAGAERWDTTYTNWVQLNTIGSQFWFASQIWTMQGDTNFAGDTVWVYLQHAPSKLGAARLDNTVGRTNLLVQKISFTSADKDTIVNSTVKLNCDSTWTGEWARGMFIYMDSLEASGGGLVNNTYKKIFSLWLNAFSK